MDFHKVSIGCSSREKPVFTVVVAVEVNVWLLKLDRGRLGKIVVSKDTSELREAERTILATQYTRHLKMSRVELGHILCGLSFLQWTIRN